MEEGSVRSRGRLPSAPPPTFLFSVSSDSGSGSRRAMVWACSAAACHGRSGRALGLQARPSAAAAVSSGGLLRSAAAHPRPGAALDGPLEAAQRRWRPWQQAGPPRRAQGQGCRPAAQGGRPPSCPRHGCWCRGRQWVFWSGVQPGLWRQRAQRPPPLPTARRSATPAVPTLMHPSPDLSALCARCSYQNTGRICTGAAHACSGAGATRKTGASAASHLKVRFRSTAGARASRPAPRAPTAAAGKRRPARRSMDRCTR